MRGVGAGQARADDDRAALALERRRRLDLAHTPARREAPAQHLPLAAETGVEINVETRARQTLAHAARGRPGGDGGAIACEARQGLHHTWRPQFRIAIGRKTVKEKRIGANHEVRQQIVAVAKPEREHHSVVLENAPMQSPQRQRPGCCQLLHEGGEFGGREAPQRVRGDRMALDRYEVQPA